MLVAREGTAVDKEMQKAIETDGEKLRQLIGEDHGPIFLDGWMADMVKEGWRVDPVSGGIVKLPSTK